MPVSAAKAKKAAAQKPPAYDVETPKDVTLVENAALAEEVSQHFAAITVAAVCPTKHLELAFAVVEEFLKAKATDKKKELDVKFSEYVKDVGGKQAERARIDADIAKYWDRVKAAYTKTEWDAIVKKKQMVRVDGSFWEHALQCHLDDFLATKEKALVDLMKSGKYKFSEEVAKLEVVMDAKKYKDIAKSAKSKELPAAAKLKELELERRIKQEILEEVRYRLFVLCADMVEHYLTKGQPPPKERALSALAIAGIGLGVVVFVGLAYGTYRLVRHVAQQLAAPQPSPHDIASETFRQDVINDAAAIIGAPIGNAGCFQGIETSVLRHAMWAASPTDHRGYKVPNNPNPVTQAEIEAALRALVGRYAQQSGPGNYPRRPYLPANPLHDPTRRYPAYFHRPNSSLARFFHSGDVPAWVAPYEEANGTRHEGAMGDCLVICAEAKRFLHEELMIPEAELSAAQYADTAFITNALVVNANNSPFYDAWTEPNIRVYDNVNQVENFTDTNRIYFISHTIMRVYVGNAWHDIDMLWTTAAQVFYCAGGSREARFGIAEKWDGNHRCTDNGGRTLITDQATLNGGLIADTTGRGANSPDFLHEAAKTQGRYNAPVHLEPGFGTDYYNVAGRHRGLDDIASSEASSRSLANAGGAAVMDTISLKYHGRTLKVRLDKNGAVDATVIASGLGLSVKSIFFTDDSGTLVGFGACKPGECLTLNTQPLFGAPSPFLSVDTLKAEKSKKSFSSDLLAAGNEISIIISRWSGIKDDSMARQAHDFVDTLERQGLRTKADLARLSASEWAELPLPVALRNYLRVEVLNLSPLPSPR